MNMCKVLILLFILSIFCFTYSPAGEKYIDGDVITVRVNDKSLNLVVAKSKKVKAKGLSDRKQIPHDGMIFFFEKAYIAAFWMKDMYFSIDIIWIADNKVVDIAENVAPQPGVPEYALKTYSPSQNANIVIEISAGSAKQLNIKQGSVIKLESGHTNRTKALGKRK
ncbi:MAG: DUF192 domain-containing protein [Endomicrobium sp.]|jgi:uncharacterized membrane protein (UPF0127 family)|nr:DUF192 domain-containing protein [Endomicrobium sp.]